MMMDFIQWNIQKLRVRLQDFTVSFNRLIAALSSLQDGVLDLERVLHRLVISCRFLLCHRYTSVGELVYFA
jgi:hypothetical protein